MFAWCCHDILATARVWGSDHVLGESHGVDSAFLSHQHLLVNLAAVYTLNRPHLDALFQKQGSDPQGP